jgi:hypothetical protein
MDIDIDPMDIDPDPMDGDVDPMDIYLPVELDASCKIQCATNIRLSD